MLKRYKVQSLVNFSLQDGKMNCSHEQFVNCTNNLSQLQCSESERILINGYCCPVCKAAKLPNSKGEQFSF